jgi:hypothetical protein
MLDSSLIRSNFVGRDGFLWWIGQVAPVDAQGGQANGAGWGNRAKVRIMGYHPYSEVELPNEDLPWAQCLLPTTSGTGAGNNASNIKVHGGDTVFGFFLDGDNAQIPVIVGCFGRTSQVPSKDYAGPFKAFTGYTDKIKNDGSRVKKNESNEQNAATQKSPRNVSPTQAKQIGSDEISYFRAIGDTVNAASPSPDNTINKITTEIDNLVKKIQSITNSINEAVGSISTSIDNLKRDINLEIDKITAKVQKIASGLVGSMVNGLYKKLAPVLNKGLKALYKSVYSTVFAATKSSSIAHKAGVAAQTALVPPISNIQKLLSCIANSVLNGLGSIIKSILKSVVENVANFVSCVANQAVGSLINSIIGGITSGLSAAMDAVSKISGGFSVANTLRNTVEGIAGLVSDLGCGEIAPNFNANTNQWVIGKGAKNAPGVPFEQILKTANEANSIAQSILSAGGAISDLVGSIGSMDFLNPSIGTPGFSSVLSSCYAGPRLNCGGTKISIFGSEGSGASAIPIFGSLVGEGRSSTGSIIGAIITSGGSGYDFPPFIEVTDECGQGYGAIGRSVINDAGEVTSIYFVSEGENYPIDEVTPTDLNAPPNTPNTNIEYIINDVLVVEPGEDYTNEDVITDNFGNSYTINTIDGRINTVTPINSNIESPNVTDPPIFTIKSEIGKGAILKGNLKKKPITPQGEIKQNIDCITR